MIIISRKKYYSFIIDWFYYKCTLQYEHTATIYGILYNPYWARPCKAVLSMGYTECPCSGISSSVESMQSLQRLAVVVTAIYGSVAMKFHMSDFHAHFSHCWLRYPVWNYPSMNITVPYPDSKVHRAYMGTTWGRQDSGGPHVSPMNLAIWALMVRQHWFS